MDLDSSIFYSRDIKRSIDFYQNVIGFKLEDSRGDENGHTAFASFIFLNGARLGIKKEADEREIPGAQTVFIGVEDAAKFYEELKAKAVTFVKELKHNEDFGRNFSILDPDGNKILFIERV